MRRGSYVQRRLVAVRRGVCQVAGKRWEVAVGGAQAAHLMPPAANLPGGIRVPLFRPPLKPATARRRCSKRSRGFRTAPLFFGDILRFPPLISGVHRRSVRLPACSVCKRSRCKRRCGRAGRLRAHARLHSSCSAAATPVHLRQSPLTYSIACRGLPPHPQLRFEGPAIRFCELRRAQPPTKGLERLGVLAKRWEAVSRLRACRYGSS